MADLSGQIALVTGAGRAAGMGRAIALRLAAAGADVAVADIGKAAAKFNVEGVGLGESVSELEETAQLVRDLGRRSVAVAIDISDRASVDDGVAKVAEALGDVTILVNNAGSAVGTAPFDDVTTEQWELAFRVNVIGAVNMTHAVLPAMRAAHAGSIVNIASTLGLAALAEYGAYTVTKHAAVGLTRLLARELAPDGIRVNGVAPGYIVTDMGRAEQEKMAKAMNVTVEDVAQSIVDDIPVRRLGQPADVAEAVAWLVDPAASFLNGAIIPVHGGQVAGFA